MSQKAICPRGHIWDPSTLAGLPPTETPRCPICGEVESSRLRNIPARLQRWLRQNPLAAGLAGLCLLLCTALAVVLFHLWGNEQVIQDEVTRRLIAASQAMDKFHSRAPAAGPKAGGNDRKRQAKLQEVRRQEREKEFAAQLREAEKTARDARLQRDEQSQQRKLAEELAQTAEQVRQDALSHRAETARQLVKMHVAEGTRLMENGDLSASLLWFTEALRLAEREKMPAKIHRLRLAAVLEQCARPVQIKLYDKAPKALQLSSDGKRVLAAASGGEVEIWDAVNGKRIGEVLKHEQEVTHAVFSPDGKHVLTAAADKILHMWDIETATEAFSLQLMNPTASIAFSNDGKRFLTVTENTPMADNSPMGATEVELHIWDASTGEPIRKSALGSEIRALPAAFSPDGQRVLTVCRDRCARIWDIATGKQVGPSFSHAADLVQAMFSADGERVFAASVDGTARVWKAETGEPMTPLFKHGSAVSGGCLSAEGKHALTFGEDGGVRVWDIDKGESAGPTLQHTDAVSDAVFSPDGRYVLAICAGGAAWLWDYTNGRKAVPALHHGESIRYAAFTGAGNGLLTWAGQTVRLWDLTVGERALPPASPKASGLEIFSPDGKLVLRATASAVRVYDTKTNQAIGGTLPHKNKVSAAAFSADGKRVLTVCHQANGDEMEGHVRVWETATGDLLGQPLVHPRSVLEAAFSPDGRRVLTACQDGRARLWEVKKSDLVGEPMEHKKDLSRALFLRDGKRLLTVDVEGGLRLWDADTAEAVGPTWGHRKPINALAFSRDGKQLVTASADGTASVWEANTGREIATTPEQSAPLLQAEFRPDGKGIVTVCGERLVRAWDAANGKPIGTPLRHRGVVACAAFSEDGERIVTLAADGLRVWDAASGEPIGPPLRTNLAPTRSTSKSMLSNELLAQQIPDIPADNRPIADLVHLSEILSAERMKAAGQTDSLDRADLKKLWQAVRAKNVKDFAPSPKQLSAWHRRGSTECEERQLWIGCLLHLNYLISEGASADLHARRGRANLELRHWQAAKKDYTQALAGDNGRWDLWAGRAEAEAALGRWQAAAADYSNAIERKGDRAELWKGRGRIEAELGDWHKAAADLGKAIHLGEQDSTVWRQYAAAMLAGGDEAGYRRWCGRMVQRFGDGKDEANFRNLVGTIALADGAVREWAHLLRCAEKAAKANPQSTERARQWIALLYRAGQFDSAQKRLQEFLEAAPAEASPRDSLLMALLEKRLGHEEEAKKWLAKAESQRGKAKDVKESWEDRLLDETFYREAKKLVDAK